jgi:FixJ family two-component response regulator
VNLSRTPGHGVGASPISSAAPIVFIVDDDVSVRESLELLSENEGWKSKTFASAQEFLDHQRDSVPSCLVLDLSLPGLNGLELQKRLAVERTDVPIIFITGHGDIPKTVQAMKAGAVEFLTKPLNNDALVSAIGKALERSRLALVQEAEIRELRARYASLTSREQQVMALVVSGLLNKQAGGELGISEITVKAHRGQVMQKMKASSLPDLVRMAAKLRPTRSAGDHSSLDTGGVPGSSRLSFEHGKSQT